MKSNRMEEGKEEKEEEESEVEEVWRKVMGREGETGKYVAGLWCGKEGREEGRK